ncbi:recombination protein RecO [Helicobacter sp. 12S02232-10]|uniref:recombination protein RecO n=1 Tax=Helicobacter sp. 12S02232-10 TaxID=1476197 RepID=UPI000BA5A852|nr:recombination protein RecO [Helicobacter sp. 12S02232-10]PAF47411.1 recombination protein RecO [Helicobacter sp. 12S02232-10]
MQGYILNTIPIKNEDLIVHILTPFGIKRLYRFYGARHSIIHLGKKIDFEEEGNGFFLPKLRNVMHLGYPWENNLDRVYIWQRFIGLLNKHLFDIYELDSFYFNMLQDGAIKLSKQNPLRVGLEMYAELLSFEGRGDKGERCFICGSKTGEQISLARAFLFAHPTCIGGKTFKKSDILKFLALKTTLHFCDEDVERMWEILTKGL